MFEYSNFTFIKYVFFPLMIRLLQYEVVTALILKGKHNNAAKTENEETVVTALILKGKHN